MVAISRIRIGRKGGPVGRKVKRFSGLRWAAIAAQTVLWLGLPFVTIGGESALRFDVPTLRLIVLGVGLRPGEYFVVLPAVLFLALSFLGFTLVLGRVWCGWACPQTAFTEYSELFAGYAGKAGRHLLVLLLSAIVSLDLIAYFISPYELIPELFAGTMASTPASIFLFFTVIIYLDIAFLGRRFCKTICPYAKLQGVMIDKDSLVVAFDTERTDECMECRACVRACPTGIDIRDGLQAGCVNCARCIDACAGVRAKRGRDGLVSYMFGGKDGRLRDAVSGKVVVISLLAAAALALTVYKTVDRDRVLVRAARSGRALYTTLPDGSVLNTYIVTLTNMQNTPDSCALTVSGIPGATAAGVDGPIPLAPQEAKTIPVAVKAAGDPLRHGPAGLSFMIKCEGGESESRVSFFYP